MTAATCKPKAKSVIQFLNLFKSLLEGPVVIYDVVGEFDFFSEVHLIGDSSIQVLFGVSSSLEEPCHLIGVTGGNDDDDVVELSRVPFEEQGDLGHANVAVLAILDLFKHTPDLKPDPRIKHPGEACEFPLVFENDIGQLVSVNGAIRRQDLLAKDGDNGGSGLVIFSQEAMHDVVGADHLGAQAGEHLGDGALAGTTTTG